MHRQTIIEEQKMLFTKPKSQYVGHFAIVTGSNPSIVNGILDYFASNEISFGDVAAAGHNWTAVNTGCIEC